ncbi:MULTISPECIES: type III secretion system inner rod subunit SctI [unclassified Pseudomonas]|uniref:type III secretion system inner rod subunit SctI n=1 Tax=unclassified Pseudomonas TaxID=196821 RepID=UPI00385DB93D
MSISSVSASGSSSIQIAELSRPASASIVSLEDRLIESFASSAVNSQQSQADINGMLARPDLTDPEVLSELQVLSAQYNIDVSLLNALVRKTVSTAETLLRSS